METHNNSEIHDRQPLSNARLGILVLLGAETMLFSGLIGTFLVFRVGNVTWPPPSHIGIELPRAVTGINTALLLLCLLYTSPSPRDRTRSRMPSSA